MGSPSSASSPPAAPKVTLAEASEVRALDANIYSANFHKAFRIAMVPHGGYVATCFLRVAALHLDRSSRGQPDTMTAHLEYLDRTEVGPAIFVVEEMKAGRQTTVLQITLYQARDGAKTPLPTSAPWLPADGTAKREVVAFVKNTDFDKLEGLTLKTGFKLEPPPDAMPISLARMRQGHDPLWCRYRAPAHHRALTQPAFKALEYYSPRAESKAGPTAAAGLLDRWIRFADGERFTGPSLGFVADAWPIIVESYRPEPPPTDEETEASQTPFPWDSLFWYPTLNMSLEVKKRLPEQGVEWLFFRVQTKQIRNGRMDMEIIVLDETGDLVALASHVCLVLGLSRNLAGRVKHNETIRSTKDEGGLIKGKSRI
ncbi:uncharacterized protein PpBr36_09198 [Pyricularia pennisetigena]|uniref:uncharacterized protein n=1 Tax=Pyricularia pennisetigena TaxID=1578925 RepID=UPI00114EE4AA|nr:uncharacterized protein PpBr36_09198 [Pyricularia pennisetigena]TLS21990.1 hypothetical protein PpBr36_09198 [Pyricularia pennisetigena]